MIIPGFRPIGRVLTISAVLTAVSLAVAVTGPDRAARNELALWLDVRGENTLPAWWGTALLLVVALAYAVTGAAARVGGVAGVGAWFAGAGVAGAFSLTELSGVHRRLGGIGRLVLGEGVLTRNWFAMAAVVVPVVAAVLVVLAARVGAPSGRLLLGRLAPRGPILATEDRPDPKTRRRSRRHAQVGDRVIVWDGETAA